MRMDVRSTPYIPTYLKRTRFMSAGHSFEVTQRAFAHFESCPICKPWPLQVLCSANKLFGGTIAAELVKADSQS